MIYYYAFSSHKYGLDCVRRGVALINALKKEGHRAQLLVNDFRAGLAAKDLGAADAITIETILDVDAVAQRGDIVILDTPEDTSSRMEQYAAEFASLFYVTHQCDYRSLYGEVVLKPFCGDEEQCIETPIVSSNYTEGEIQSQKEERILFFWGDADYNKEILSHVDFFGGKEMDLLMGHYFFVKYENELAKIFHRLIEAEEYAAVLTARSRILTASIQCAFEAKAAGAEVVYMSNRLESECTLSALAHYDIKIIDYFKKNDLLNIFSTQNKGLRRVKSAHEIAKKLFLSAIYKYLI